MAEEQAVQPPHWRDGVAPAADRGDVIMDVNSDDARTLGDAEGARFKEFRTAVQECKSGKAREERSQQEESEKKEDGAKLDVGHFAEMDMTEDVSHGCPL